MLEMSFCVVHRMVGGEEVNEISYKPYFMEYYFDLCHSTGIASSSDHIMTSMTLRHSLDGFLDLHVTSRELLLFISN